MAETPTNANGNGHAATGDPVSANGHATKSQRQPRKATGRKATSSEPNQQDLSALIDQAEALRGALRDALVKTSELLKGLKRHRRQSRALQQTIAQLRTLKTLGV